MTTTTITLDPSTIDWSPLMAARVSARLTDIAREHRRDLDRGRPVLVPLVALPGICHRCVAPIANDDLMASVVAAYDHVHLSIALCLTCAQVEHLPTEGSIEDPTTGARR